MKKYQDISLDAAQFARDNQKLKKEFGHILTDVRSFNGSVPGISDLSFSVTDSVIEIDFVGHKYQINYRYKRVNEKSLGVLCLYEILDNEDKELKGEYEFDFGRNICGADMAFNSELETMAIILNILVSAVQS